MAGRCPLAWGFCPGCWGVDMCLGRVWTVQGRGLQTLRWPHQPLQSVFLSVGWALVSKPQTPVLSLLLETSGESEEGSLQKTENLYPNPR